MQTIKTTEAGKLQINAQIFAIEATWVALNGNEFAGAFKSRAAARAAGTALKASELQFEIEQPAPVEVPAEAKQGDAVANAAETKTLLPNAAEILAQQGCPYCGDTSNGCTYDDAPGHETNYLFCHVCNTSFHQVTGALRGKGKKIEMTRFSTIEHPCKQVWHIADAMAEKVGGFKNLRRKDVLAHCVASGIAFYTARTQYQLWLTIQNGGSI